MGVASLWQSPVALTCNRFGLEIEGLMMDVESKKGRCDSYSGLRQRYHVVSVPRYHCDKQALR
jgi:hypothetical protein